MARDFDNAIQEIRKYHTLLVENRDEIGMIARNGDVMNYEYGVLLDSLKTMIEAYDDLHAAMVERDNNKARLTLLDDADDVLIPKRHPNHVVVRFKNKESAMAFYLWVIEHGGWDED